MDNHVSEGLLKAQKEYFASGATLDILSRRAALKALGKAIDRRESRLLAALESDLGKCRAESYMCELGLVKGELSYMLGHIKSLAAPKRVRTPLAQFPSRSYVQPSPLGCVLVMSPWNYPLLLTLGPMIDALAAGNTVIAKPSAYSPACSAQLEELIAEVLSPALATVVTGGRRQNQDLMGLPFDHIFFTGSKEVGRQVLAAAAPGLVPVTLELGGKSPCIVDQTADIPLAARRIVFGKLLNCGQTCVAPDYIYCHNSVKERLSACIKKELTAQLGDYPLGRGDWGRIINQGHFDRLLGLMDSQKITFGGRFDRQSLKIEPTLMENVTWQDAVMGQEIFGPILPVMGYERLEEALAEINGRDRPLALYIFSGDKKTIRHITTACRYGGGCVNDAVIHLATSHMAFGGVGESGMGGYHGKAGFDNFSHHKSIVDKKTWLDLPMRYRPYTTIKDRLVRLFVK